MPNAIAYATLICWPIVILLQMLKLPPRRAVVWSFLAALLILPVGTKMDFPGVPPLDKTIIPNLSALAFAILLLKQRVVAFPRSALLTTAMVVFVISPLFTTLGNGDPIFLAMRTVPGMALYDGIAACVGQALILIPFVMGYSLLGDEQGHREILLALVLAGLAYSIPMLLEVRFSPQLHSLLYGYFPHSFAQQMRWGGFRPVVFLGHGLLVAIFCAMAFLAACHFARHRLRLKGIPGSILALYLFVVLVLCKSLGALALTLLIAPIFFMCRPRTMTVLAGLVAIVILTYPLLRGSKLIPIATVSSTFGLVSTDRQDSLLFRLENEDKLLAKAGRRPVFGWGTWGRNRIYDGYQDGDSSVTDGTWIIIVGVYGWAGYLAAFGLLCYPLIAPLSKRAVLRNVAPATASLGLVLLINLIDLIPNSSLTPLTWLLAGALCGSVSRKGPAPAGAAPDRLN